MGTIGKATTAIASYGNTYRRIERENSTTYSAFAPAKLNLRLDIGELDKFRMHILSGTMQAITICDHVTLERLKGNEQKIEGCLSEGENIIAKALQELAKRKKEVRGWRVTVQKVIPVSSGMGGGSSDAATVLRLANCAFGLDMQLSELHEVAEEVGNDVAFLLRGGRANAEGGKRQKLTSIAVPDVAYLVARPDLLLSTTAMFKLHDNTGKSFTELASELCSDTERLLKELSADPNTTKDQRSGNRVVGVTGKGPTVFAEYLHYEYCKAANERLGLWFNGERGDRYIARPLGALSTRIQNNYMD